jgi:hypothetical protein
MCRVRPPGIPFLNPVRNILTCSSFAMKAPPLAVLCHDHRQLQIVELLLNVTTGEQIIQ